MRDKRTWALIAALSALSLGPAGCAGPAARTASSSKSPAGAAAQPQPTDAAEPLVRNDSLSSIPELAPVYFDFDSGLLNGDASATLRKNADWLKANEAVRVQVAGRCDQRGTVAYNLALGQRRAASVRDYYIKLGVSGSRIATISYGKEDPVCSEASEECWGKNRTGTTLKATPADISGIDPK